MVSIEQLPSAGRADETARALNGLAPVSLDQVAALLAGLNREQRRAVTHGDGPLLVLAGPGTGKTEVLTRRIAWLIATKRAEPRQILALTFTQKAAMEMQQRVDLLVPYGQADTAIHTFHAFGDRVLREHAFELGLPGDLRLIGRSEAIVLLREQIFSLELERYRPLAEPGRFLGALVDLFCRAKDEGILPQQLATHARGLAAQASGAPEQDRAALLDLSSAQEELARAYGRYQALLLERGLIDHADQVLLALRLLRERPAVRRALQERYRYVLVDEFQDTNPAQLEVVLALAGQRSNVCVVGDDDQAIYAFRGAAVSNLRRFVAAHPGLRRVVLRRNYRSRAPIIEASQRLIRHNDPGRLATLDGLHSTPVAHRRSVSARPVRLQAFASRADEADGVAAEIEARLRAGAAAADFAVLVRTNGEVDTIVRSLAVKGVPVRSSAPLPLSGRPEIRALVSFLRVVADPRASQELYALATAAPYGLGGQELTGMLSLARRRHLSLWEVLAELNERPELAELAPGTRRRLARLVADVRAAIDMSHSSSTGEVLYDFLRRSGRLARLVRESQAENDPRALADIVRFFELVRGQARLLNEDRVGVLVPHLAELVEGLAQPDEDGPASDDAVSVLTVHRAKGLEFPIVYLCGLVDGRFPLRARPAALALPAELLAREPEAETDDLAEERRLCYVAMTRARDELVLSYALESQAGRAARSCPTGAGATC
jgi:DNA helicase II / ATP-dependent DNA helicase PcrA